MKHARLAQRNLFSPPARVPLRAVEDERTSPSRRGGITTHELKSRARASIFQASGVVPLDRDVLIVDDDLDSRQILLDCLTHAGFRVLLADNRGEALEFLALGVRPRLLLMDLMMPGPSMDAFASTAQALQIQSFPIYVISAASEVEVPTPKGALERFLKPVDLKQIVEKVRSVLGTDPAKPKL
jgi:CheY-like chemotaxis protein